LGSGQKNTVETGTDPFKAQPASTSEDEPILRDSSAKRFIPFSGGRQGPQVDHPCAGWGKCVGPSCRAAFQRASLPRPSKHTSTYMGSNVLPLHAVSCPLFANWIFVNICIFANWRTCCDCRSILLYAIRVLAFPTPWWLPSAKPFEFSPLTGEVRAFESTQCAGPGSPSKKVF
jgi:hypothetical protein